MHCSKADASKHVILFVTVSNTHSHRLLCLSPQTNKTQMKSWTHFILLWMSSIAHLCLDEVSGWRLIYLFFFYKFLNTMIREVLVTFKYINLALLKSEGP